MRQFHPDERFAMVRGHSARHADRDRVKEMSSLGLKAASGLRRLGMQDTKVPLCR